MPKWEKNFGTRNNQHCSELELPLSIRMRVLLTMLRKLYTQSGSGRKQSALFRGLDQRARQVVPEILDFLVREELAIKSSVGEETVWFPVRSESVRGRRLRSASTESKDLIVQKAAADLFRKAQVTMDFRMGSTEAKAMLGDFAGKYPPPAPVKEVRAMMDRAMGERTLTEELYALRREE